ALAADAGKRLGAAGIRAWKRADVHAAVNLLTRATSLLPSEDEFRRELLCELGLAHRAGGEIDRGQEALAAAIEAASGAHDRRVDLRARIELTAIELLTDPQADPEALITLAGDAIPVFEGVRDDRSLGRTWHIVGHVHGGFRCQMASWAHAAEE